MMIKTLWFGILAYEILVAVLTIQIEHIKRAWFYYFYKEKCLQHYNHGSRAPPPLLTGTETTTLCPQS